MTDFHSGFIAILGKPNVGKSTLINRLLGQKIAAVSPRPQTTRRRQLGILTTSSSQLIFIDTPGIHNPRHKLGQFFNQEAEEALEGVDIILFMVDASSEPDEDDQRIANLLSKLRRKPKMVLGLNKIDLVRPEEVEERQAAYRALTPKIQVLPFSATSQLGLDDLVVVLTGQLPIRPAEFPNEQLTYMKRRLQLS
jgi:GTP-binding protein Era